MANKEEKRVTGEDLRRQDLTCCLVILLILIVVIVLLFMNVPNLVFTR